MLPEQNCQQHALIVLFQEHQGLQVALLITCYDVNLNDWIIGWKY